MKRQITTENAKIVLLTLVLAFGLGLLASGCTLSQAEALRTIQSVHGIK